MSSNSNILEAVIKVIPKLTANAYKGQAGKIGVVGGCLEYTGAPYYAAISALKLGADLSHVFCEVSAGVPIKAYSPDLIVHPVLPSRADERKGQPEPVVDWFSRLNVLVIGPGLGRDPVTIKCISDIIKKARSENLPLVIDGDGLFIVTQSPELIQGYNKTILTPNLNEYKRLASALSESEDADAKQISKRLGNVTIVRKGHKDVITNGDIEVECAEEGSLRRVGGQGDILAGSVGTFFAWALNSKELPPSLPPAIVAGYAGCYITKHASQEAFLQKKRSTITTDMLEHLGNVMNKLAPV